MRLALAVIILLNPVVSSHLNAQKIQFGVIGGASLTPGMIPVIESYPGITDPQIGVYTLNFFDRSEPYSPVFGPSFRVWQEPLAVEPSKVGVSAGVGVDFTFGRFKAGPVLRYTRWKADGVFPRLATRPDQLELLGGITYETAPSTRRIGERKLWFGVPGGGAPTKGFAKRPLAYPIEEKMRWLAGVSLETHLYKSLSLELDAIYRPLYGRTVFEVPGFPIFRDPFMVITWQFPVLAKYRFAGSRFTPFAAAGPSFCASGNKNSYEPAHLGATGAAGIETLAGPFRLAPSLRHTRWQSDGQRFARTNPNQVEILFSLTF